MSTSPITKDWLIRLANGIVIATEKGLPLDKKFFREQADVIYTIANTLSDNTTVFMVELEDSNELH